MEMNKLGRSIQMLRESHMMTREDFAQVIGVLRKTVVDWEEGRAVPTAEQVIAIAEFCGVDPRSLVDESGEKTEIPPETEKPKKDHRLAVGIVCLIIGVSALFGGVMLMQYLTGSVPASAPAVTEETIPLPDHLPLAALELPQWDLDGDGKKELVNPEGEEILFVKNGTAYALAEPLPKGQTLSAQDGVFIVKNEKGESSIFSVLQNETLYPAG